MKKRWGFKWGQVASGGAMFLFFGGLTAILWAGGRFNGWIGAMAGLGFFVMFDGLMGEDGIW
ncbi:MAG: hypothetical protein K8T25_12500 [Planctomycetia bacterium]|nr:hypothetical protein [Planctomycetia bacterium]